MRTFLNDKLLVSSQAIIYCKTDFTVLQLNNAAKKFFTPHIHSEKFNLTTQFDFGIVNIPVELLLDILSHKKSWNGTVSLSFNKNITQYYIATISLEIIKNKKYFIIQLKTSKINKKKELDSDLLFSNHFKKVLSASNEGFVLMNKNYLIVSINIRAQSITKITHGQSMQIGHSMFEYLPSEVHPYCISVTEQVLKGEKVKVVSEYPGLNGKKTYLNSEYIPAYDNDGNIMGVIIHFVDVTEQHYNKIQIEDAAMQMQSILNATNEGLGMITLDYKVILYNEKMNYFLKTLFKIPKGGKIGADFFDYILPERKEIIKQVFDRTAKGEKIELQNRFYDKWMLASYTPVRDKSEKIIAVCISIRDITDIIKKQMEIEQSELKYSTALNNLSESVLLLDSNCKILKLNQETEKIFEFDKNPLKLSQQFSLAKRGFKIENSKDHYILNHQNWSNISGNIKDVVLYKSINKKRSIFLLNIAVIDDIALTSDLNKSFVISLRDISNVEKMSESINQLSMIAMKIPNAVIISDKNGYIQWVNSGFSNMFGYSFEEVIGKIPAEILEGLETDSAESKLIQKNIKKRITFSSQLLNYHKDGTKVWVNLSKQPVFDSKGNFIQYYSILTDITQRKNLEKQLEEERKDNQNNITRAVYKAYEEERSFLSKELHDSVNQKITASIFNLTRLQKNKKEDPQLLQSSLDMLKESMAEIRNLSRKLIATEMLHFKFDEAVLQLVHYATQSLADFKSEVKISPKCDRIISDELKVNIFRIIQEQIQNIIKHSAATNLTILAEITPDNLLELTTIDNGKGFHLYELKNGIGLINILNRIESFNGMHNIISAPGKGCRFHIYFPLTQKL